MINNERWETIKDFPNYMISSESRVLNKTTLNMVATPVHQHGYRCVRLWRNNKTRLFKIYRLKAMHFIPNPDNKKQVNHIDGNRMNEDLDNLEWTTAKENMKHAYLNGLSAGHFKKGMGGYSAGVSNRKLSFDDVTLIQRWYRSGFYDERKMNKIFNISNHYATRVAKGKEAQNV